MTTTNKQDTSAVDNGDLSTNAENCQIVWLETSKTLPISDQLYQSARNLNATVAFFSEVEKSIVFMRSIKHEQILFVTSEPLLESELLRIHLIEKLSSIFILSNDKKRWKHLLKRFHKIINIFNDRNEILASVYRRMLQTEADTVSVASQMSNEGGFIYDLVYHKHAFIWHELLMYYLTSMSRDKDAMKDLIDKCKDYYKDSPLDLAEIDTFRNQYKQEDAIKLYMKQSFLRKILNKILRTDKFEWMYSLRLILIDLQAHFKKEKEKFEENRLLTVYHGHRTDVAEVQNIRNSLHHVISINNFFIATDSFHIAHEHADCISKKSRTSRQRIGVLYQIIIDPNMNAAFCNVNEDSSTFRQAKSILFFPYVTFFVNSINVDEVHKLCTINMTLQDTSDNQVINYTNDYREMRKMYSPFINFGHIIAMKLGQKDAAERYFKSLVVASSLNHQDRISSYEQLALISTSKNDWTNGISYYEQAKKYSMEQQPADYTLAIEHCIHIGNSHHARESVDKAIEAFEEAIIIMNKHLSNEKSQHIQVYRQIGKSYEEFAMKCKQQSKSSLATSALCRASLNIENAHRIQKNIEPTNYLELASIMCDLCRVNATLNNLNKTKDFLKELLLLVVKNLSSNQSIVKKCIETFESCCDISQKQNFPVKIDLNEFIENYETIHKGHHYIIKKLIILGLYDYVCYMLFEIQPFHQDLLFECMKRLCDFGHFEEARKWLRKWDDYCESYPALNNRKRAKQLLQLAYIQDKFYENNKANRALADSLKIYRADSYRLGMRSVEDARDHFKDKPITPFHMANIVCRDKSEMSVL